MMKRATNFKELPADLLKWSCDLEKIPFRTTDECKPCEGIIGQERALKAIQTGLEIKSLGYNIFITGMVGILKGQWPRKVSLSSRFRWVFL